MSARSLIQLGLLALVLFSVSAGLSVWLNQAKESPGDAKDPEAAKPAAGPKDEKPADKAPPPKTLPKADPGGTSDPAPGAAGDARAREDLLDRRQARIELVTKDLQALREEVEGLQRQATEATGRAAQQAREQAAAPPAAKLPAPDPAGDPDAIKRMAAMYDNMTPESASLILKQMADSGRLDTAVRILGQMQPRQASRVLAEIEPALAAQLLDKMRTIKKPAPAAAGVPAGGIPPAGTGSNLPPAAPAVPPRTP